MFNFSARRKVREQQEEIKRLKLKLSVAERKIKALKWDNELYKAEAEVAEENLWSLRRRYWGEEEE